MFKFGNKKDKAADSINLEVLFHKDTNPFGEHGTIYASHVGMGLVNEPVRFYFKDVAAVPVMTPVVLSYLFDQLERHGWQPHSLRSYATVFTVMPAPRMNGQIGAGGATRPIKRAAA